MTDIQFTIIQQRATPPIQTFFALLMGWAGMLICRLIHQPAGSEFFAALVAIIFFSITNTVVSIAYKSYLRYTLPSFYLFILLVVLLFLSARWISGISIWHTSMHEYRMMLISISIFFLVITHLVRIIRAVYNLVEKEP